MILDDTKTPKQKAKQLREGIKFPLFRNCLTMEKGIAIKIQEGLIEKLSEYGIHSDYENEVLTELKNLKRWQTQVK